MCGGRALTQLFVRRRYQEFLVWNTSPNRQLIFCLCLLTMSCGVRIRRRCHGQMILVFNWRRSASPSTQIITSSCTCRRSWFFLRLAQAPRIAALLGCAATELASHLIKSRKSPTGARPIGQVVSKPPSGGNPRADYA